MNKKVGFIGLGNMGLPMAKNLISAGFEVHCLDVKKDKENEVIEIGGKSGHTIPTLLKKVDIVLTSLPTPKVVESVYFGEEGLIDNSPENNILIDLSTISPELDNKIGETAKTKKVNYLGAPVSGSVSGAEAATLSIIVGGKEKTFNDAYPYLEAIGKNIFHVGEDYGIGTVVKLINKLLAGIHTQAAAEALSIADSVGLDHDIVHEILTKSTGQSAMLTRNYPNFISKNEYEKGKFTNALLLKDVKLANDVSESYDNNLPIGKFLSEYLDANLEDYKDMDMSSTYLKLKENK